MLSLATLMVSALIYGTPVQAVGAPSTLDDPVRVEDVVVSSRRLQDEAEAFVAELAAPPPKRGLARWRGPICIGVANLSESVARPLIDHIATVASAIGQACVRGHQRFAVSAGRQQQGQSKGGKWAHSGIRIVRLASMP